MNHIFKTISKKIKGRVNTTIVVSENASSLTKTTDNRSSLDENQTYSDFYTTLKQVLSVSLASILFVSSLQADIIADTNAPTNTQPIILNTQSGATQVNIQTPTSSGISVNNYSQFDTGTNGTILNNSRTNVNTVTAGWVEGNPFLATGSATAIVNQVNSSNPSNLTGNIEIAGSKADLIIANPSGISIDGATIINAGTSTLTTGTPIINSGDLSGFSVNDGTISVQGAGLNALGSDYTNILARSTAINAGIWANELSIITGVNTISRDSSNITAGTGVTTAPLFAIDSSALGGMYANKINLIGTEAGVGVNNAGVVGANDNISIDINGKLTNSGTVVSSNNMDIKSTNLVNNKTISSNSKTIINVNETLTNSGTINSNGKLSINTKDVDNHATGEISATSNIINVSDTLTNQGLIDGSQTVVKAQTLNNIGTGRVYGDWLALQADTINNIKESDKSAVIGAREELNIGATTINNIDGSTILSLGSLNIGGSLDENGFAIDKAKEINNLSATIESSGDMGLASDEINNIGKVEIEYTSYFRNIFNDNILNQEDFDAYKINNTGSRHWEQWSGYRDGLNGTKDWIKSNNYYDYLLQLFQSEIEELNENHGQEHYLTFQEWQSYIVDTSTRTPAYIISGGDISVNANMFTNKDASMLIGGDATLNTSINNTPTQIMANTKEVDRTIHWWTKHHTTSDNDVYLVFDFVDKNVGATLIGGQSSILAGGSIAGNFGSLQNGMEENSPLVQQNSAVSDEFSNTTVDTSLPNSSLFTTNPDNPNYFIQTDPRFTNYKNFISSDYMLSKLSLDPTTLHKRLGDGYYEQKLIREQVMTLTGKRFLEGFNSDEEQYMALLNSGVEYMKSFDISAGVALSSEQMKNLTKDVVLLVEKEITLSDGTKTTALVPQLYTTASKINTSGSLIAANSINVNVANTLSNGGKIYSDTTMNIQANALTNNQGTLSANNALNITTTNDIQNLSGAISGSSVALTSTDGSIINKTLTQEKSIDHTVGKETYTVVGKKATITATGNNDVPTVSNEQVINSANNKAMMPIQKEYTLNKIHDTTPSETSTSSTSGNVILNAKNDIVNSGADISGTNSISLKAGDTINVDTIIDERSYDFKLNNGYMKGESITNIASYITSDGNIVMQSGNDINIKGSAVNSSFGATSLRADNDMNILSSTNTANYDEAYYYKKSGLFSSKKTTTIDTAKITTSVASYIGGDTVNLSSGKDTTIQGSNIISDNGTRLEAGGDINILSSVDTLDETHFKEVKKSGFFASFSDGVASVGYNKSDNKSQNNSQQTQQVASNIVSIYGDTSINANNKLQITASNIEAGKDIKIVAKDVNMIDAQDTLSEQNSKKSSSKGFSIGVTLDAYTAAKSAYDNAKGNTPDTGGFMNKFSREFEGSNAAIGAATTPIVVTAHNTKSSSQEDHITSTTQTTNLTAGGNLSILATEGSINSKGTQMNVEGDALLVARDDINLDVSHNTEYMSTDSNAKGFTLDNRASANDPFDIFGIYSNKGNGTGFVDTITGTQLSVGGKATIGTTQGNITLTGANIVANGDVNINAAKDLTIQSAQDTKTDNNEYNNKAIGKVYISDTERFSGYHNEKHDDNDIYTSQISSNVASLEGNVNLSAGDAYTQTSSNVMAANDLSIIAKTIDINTANNTGVSESNDKDLKIGAFARVNSPLIDLINNVDAARESDGRLQTMQTMAAVANGYQLASAASYFSGGAGSGSLISAEVGVGFTSSKNSENTTYDVAQESAISGGNNVTLTTTEGDIHATGANITAGNTLSLDSAKNIILDASEDKNHFDSKRSASGIEVGVGVSVGAQTGVYAYVAVQASKGETESDSLAYNNTHLSADTINITSKEDTTLRGADARGNTINADIGGNLNIESLQDTAISMSEDSGMNLRIQVSFGTAWGVGGSGGVNDANANGTYAGVNQQSGFFAEDGGYHIVVDGDTNLIGGAISSTNAQNSELTTASLAYLDIINHSEYEADTASISGGYNMTNKTPNYNASIPIEEDGESTTTTYATLTEGNINIGGEQTSATNLGIHTDTDTAHTTVDKLPDLKELLSNQQAMAAAATTVIQTSQQISQDIASSAETTKDNIKKELEETLTPEERKEYDSLNKEGKEIMLLRKADDATLATYTEASTTLSHWGVGGDYSRALSVVTNIIVGSTSGQTNTQLATNALAPYASALIGDTFDHTDDPNKAAQLLSHAILGAIIARANGGNEYSGAASAVVSEETSMILARELYPEAFDENGNFDRSQLNEEQANGILALSSAIGAFTAGLSGGSVYDASVGGFIGQNAVEENRLTKQQASVELANRVKNCVMIQGRSGNDCGKNIHIVGVGLNPDGSYSGYVIKDEKTDQIYADPVYSKENPPTFYVNENGYTIITTQTTGNDYLAISLGLYFVGINYVINTHNGNAYFGYSLAGSNEMFRPVLGGSILTGTIYSDTNIVNRGKTTDDFLKGFSASATGCYIGCVGVNQSFNPTNVSNIGNENWAVEYGVGAGISVGIGQQFEANQ